MGRRSLSLLVVLSCVLLSGFRERFLTGQEDNQPASSQNGYLGTWNMTSETNDNPVLWKLIISQQDGKLAATTSTTADSAQQARNVALKNGVLHLQTDYQGTPVDLELRLLDNGTLSGMWATANDQGKTRGMRAPKPSA